MSATTTAAISTAVAVRHERLNQKLIPLYAMKPNSEINIVVDPPAKVWIDEPVQVS